MRGRCSCVQWHRDAKDGTAAWRVFDLDVAAIRLDRPLGDRQTKTSPATVSRSRLIDPEETVEDPLAMFAANAGSLVADFSNRLAVSRVNAHLNRGAMTTVFDRVVQDVADRFPQNQPIDDHLNLIRYIHLELLTAILGEDRQRRCDLLDQLPQVGDL